ncbi:hypothetical protein [Bradyrhizobium cosmicum]|uniref:hypothetical protein n=1 Tax=Bradyrhizobium cosmicum TaxID=1404864 RepID=UPI001181C5D7|nr:hypothetical protein [Bradyrhizobium cosmicum]
MGLPAGAMLIGFGYLIIYAAPEYDDFCIALNTTNSGFLSALINFYKSWSGRLPAIALIQSPEFISAHTRMSMLSAYSLVLAIIYVSYLVGAITAFARFCQYAGVATIFSLCAVFVATTIAVSPDPHEMLFWLPGSACYIPPTAAAIVFLAELFRLDELTNSRVSVLSVMGCSAAMFNEFTGVWLVLVLIGSFSARLLTKSPLQLSQHVLMAAAVVIGLTIIMVAPGNSHRQAAVPNAGHFLYSIWMSSIYSAYCLFQLLCKPAVYGLLLVAAILGNKSTPRMDRKNTLRLVIVLVAVSSSCCYFEFFTHEYATGVHLVGRAQNQAVIFLLFGLSLALYAFAPHIPVPWALDRLRPGFVTFIAALTLALSPVCLLAFSQASSFRAFYFESAERDRLLREGATAIPKHRAKPSLLLGNDADSSTDCISQYYGSPQLTVLD